jgi:hypothetical protein
VIDCIVQYWAFVWRLVGSDDALAMVCLVLRVRTKYDEIMFNDCYHETSSEKFNGFDILILHYSTMIFPSSPVHTHQFDALSVHLAPRSSSANMAPKTPETQSMSDIHSCTVGLGVGLLLVMAWVGPMSATGCSVRSGLFCRSTFTGPSGAEKARLRREAV